MQPNPYQSPQSSLPFGAQANSQTTYSVPCPCGRDVEVSKAHAGGVVNCVCGAEVRIPRLSELRRSAGQEPYALSTIDRIRTMIAKGELPAGDLCQITYKPTSDVLHFTIECETPYVRQHSWWTLLLLAMVSMVAYWRASQEHAPAMGRELFIDVPLRLAADCHGSVRRLSQKRLRGLLRAEPLYAQLLEEYPQARIRVH